MRSVTGLCGPSRMFLAVVLVSSLPPALVAQVPVWRLEKDQNTQIRVRLSRVCAK